MKKIIILSVLLFVSYTFQAQFSVVTYDSSTMNETGVINDGDVFAYNTTSYDVASIYFWVKNDNAHSINLRIVYEEINNANGTDFEFCFGGLCIFAVEEGVNYPEEGGPVVINAGGQTVDFDHFLNKNEGDGTNYPIDYVIKFFEVDANDNPIGNPITFTYRFDPTMDIEDFSQVNASIQNTLVETQLNIVAQEQVQLQVFDIQGKLISDFSLETGVNSLEMSGLSAGLYFGKLQNQAGQSEVFKFVKK